MSASTLPFGRFIGKISKEIVLRDFSLSSVLDRREDEVETHTHEDAHFLFVLDGTYITQAKHVDTYCSASTLIFNPAGTTHRDRFSTRGGRFFTVSIKTDALERLQADNYHTLDESVGFSNGEIIWVMSRLCREAQNKDHASQIVMEGMAIELVGQVLRSQLRISTHRPRWIEMAHEVIRDRFTESLNLKELAETVGVHHIYLARVFRKHYGMSIGEYIRSLRIDLACREIAAKKESLTQIALSAGFYDQSHFYRTFKQATGLTPTEYQKNFS